jgi:cytochrome c oxidase subunit I
MQISKTLRRLIYWELGIPIALLTIGIYHGLMQTIYRSGLLHQPNFIKLDYYQGLTLHGVINAVVLTSFLRWLSATHAWLFSLKRNPIKKWPGLASGS